MARIRIIVGATPGLLRDIVIDAVLAQPDMELIGVEGETSRLRREAAPPDVLLVCGHDPDDSTAANRVFARWPRCRVLIVALSGDQIVKYELRPHKQALREISLEELLTAIRCRRDP